MKQYGMHCRNMHRQSVQVNHFKVKNAVEKALGISRFQRRTKNMSAQEELKLKKVRQTLEDICFLVEKAKIFGVVPRGYQWAQSVGLFEDDDYFWSYACDHFGHLIDPEGFEEKVEIARRVLTEGLDNELEIDFDDMIYAPAVKKLNSERYDIVLVDEAQDLNHLQRYLLSEMIEPGGILVAVGDAHQSCYAFRGADEMSMDNIQHDYSCVSYPLSISYRCPKSIVALAQTVYEEIESAPDAPEGSVEYPENWKIDDFTPGNFIICRNNAPIVGMAYKLIKNKIPAKVLGRDIGEGLIRLIRKLDQDGSLVEMMTALVEWQSHQLELAHRKNPDDVRSKDSINDRFECISILATNPDIKTVAELITTIDMMFANAAEEKEAVSPNRVTLSTIHKAKGLEAETVFILDRHLISPPWIRQEWEFTQERNISFIALTRSKDRLIFINSNSVK